VQNTLQLTGGSITAQNSIQSANYAFEPAPHVDPGAEYFAIQRLAFYVKSGEIGSTSNFDVSQLSVVFESGELDYYFTLGRVGSVPLLGNLSLATANATLRSTGANETLTLPMDTDFSVILQPFGTSVSLPMHLSGVVVAVAPEPGSLVLLLLPVVLLVRRSRGLAR
jgi:hypothetical protein